MGQERVDGFLVAVDDLEDTVGKPCLGEQFGQADRHGRVPLAGLENEGVAAGECRAGLPERDHRREVERGGDTRDHTERLADRVDVDAVAGTLGELALQQMRDADGELDDLDSALDVTEGIGVGLAVLERQCGRELVGVLVDQVHEAHEDAGTTLRVPRRPFLLRLRGGGDGGGDLVGRRERHLGLHGTGTRVEDVGEAATLGGDALAVQEVRDGRDSGSGHGDHL